MLIGQALTVWLIIMQLCSITTAAENLGDELPHVQNIINHKQGILLLKFFV